MSYIISWCKSNQLVLEKAAHSCSSTEVEYRAVASAVAETNWVQNLLREFQVNNNVLPTIYYGNINATYLCHNPVFHSRMQYISVNFYFFSGSSTKQTSSSEVCSCWWSALWCLESMSVWWVSHRQPWSIDVLKTLRLNQLGLRCCTINIWTNPCPTHNNESVLYKKSHLS